MQRALTIAAAGFWCVPSEAVHILGGRAAHSASATPSPDEYVTVRTTLGEIEANASDHLITLRSRSGQKCLNFLHIPKTAGTSIEVTAEKQRDDPSDPVWGAYNEVIKCERPFRCPWHVFGLNSTCCYLGVSASQPGDPNCSVWHVPPKADGETARSYANGCDTFCVVRHPVARMVSEFAYQGGACDITRFGEWLRSSLAPGLDPYRKDCHHVPQVDYVFSGDRSRRFCQHVLQYDNIEEEFNALMQSFDIPLSLQSRREQHKGCELNLTRDLRDLIADAYKEDFGERSFRFDGSLMRAVFDFSP